MKGMFGCFMMLIVCVAIGGCVLGTRNPVGDAAKDMAWKAAKDQMWKAALGK